MEKEFEIVGVRFKSCGRIYDFDVADIEVNQGDSVVVESEFGLSIGTVVRGKVTVSPPERELKKIIRLASDEDRAAQEENRKLEKEAWDFCLERIMARGLPMKLVGTEATLDRRRILFYFTAEGRIDFRELVKDLAARFKTRIEMRQIGVRDEAKIIGGIGVCGRELCCATFLTSFEPVSIKMAKRQELVLNVGKLSGQCGRLLCCLRYEYEGDLESIALDDEIPIGEEDAPVESFKERTSEVRAPKKEHPRGAPREHPSQHPQKRPQPAKEARTGEQAETAEQDREKGPKDRPRGKRRRFRK